VGETHRRRALETDVELERQVDDVGAAGLETARHQLLVVVLVEVVAVLITAAVSVYLIMHVLSFLNSICIDL